MFDKIIKSNEHQVDTCIFRQIEIQINDEVYFKDWIQVYSQIRVQLERQVYNQIKMQIYDQIFLQIEEK